MIRRNLKGKSSLCIDLVTQAVHVHRVCFRLDCATHTKKLEVLILSFKEELGCSSRGSLWIVRQSESTCLQQFSNCEELRLQSKGGPVHSSHEVLVGHMLKEHHRQLPTQGLALVIATLLPCKGLVLGDVKSRGWG